MRAQETEIEKSRTRVDTRDHEESESEGYFSGRVHCRGCTTKTDRNMQVYIQITQNRFFYIDKLVNDNRIHLRYWHRSLNPRKLIDIKFSHLTRNMTMQRTLKLYKLPDTTKVPGFRKLVYADVPQAHKILTEVSIRTERIDTHNTHSIIATFLICSI